jgi:hypothetical protein
MVVFMILSSYVIFSFAKNKKEMFVMYILEFISIFHNVMMIFHALGFESVFPRFLEVPSICVSVIGYQHHFHSFIFNIKSFQMKRIKKTTK